MSVLGLSKTFLKAVARYQNQLKKIKTLDAVFDKKIKTFYGKSKLNTDIGNILKINKRINPLEMSQKNLNNLLKQNAEILRDYASQKGGSADYVEALVSVRLLEESRDKINWDSLGWQMVKDGKISGESDVGETAFNELGSEILIKEFEYLNITEQELKRALSRSSLSAQSKYYVESVVKGMWYKKR